MILASFLLLFAVTATITAAPSCPYSESVVCGTDGKVYKNICQLLVASVYNNDLEVLPCNQLLYLHLQRELLPVNDDNILRKRKENKKKNNKRNKKLSDADKAEVDKAIEFYTRLASLPFDFRRDDDQDDQNDNDI